MQPSAKGTIVLGVVASLRKLRRSGRVSDEQLSARLSAAALDLLEQKIEIARWYPMAAFAELADADWDFSAGRDPDHAREGGAQSARHLFEAGRYQQLDFAKRATRPATVGELRLQAKLITTITAAFYNFLETDVRVEGGDLQIVYQGTGAFPEFLRYATEGFMNEITRRQGAKRSWRSERPSPDRIVFSLELPQLMRS